MPTVTESFSSSTIVAPPPPPRPELFLLDLPAQSQGQAHRRRLWILLGILLGSGFLVLAFSATRALFHGHAEADVLASQLHSRVNQQDWHGLYEDATTSYRDRVSAAESQALFSAVLRKLGPVTGSEQLTTFVQVDGAGSLLTCTFRTHFAGGEQAIETIQWRSLGGSYHLHSYSIESLALVTK